jgi:hypothetical protein
MNVLLRATALASIATLSLPVFAQSCPGGTNSVSLVGALVRGKTMCAARGGDRWQEFHQVGGNLIDYKLGPSDPVDPTETVGTWSAGTGLLTHDYGGGGSYVWAVCREGGPTSTTFTLVSTTAGTITGVTLQSGQVPCP